MKKQTLLVLGITYFALTQLSAQIVFCPKGAVWTGCYLGSIFGPNQFMSSITYSGDSIAGTDTIKTLSHSKFYHQCNKSTQTRTLIRQRGDTVFMNSKFTLNTWQILFNYACTAGQGWTTTYNTISNGVRTESVTVDSTGTFIENNMTLKRLFVTRKNSAVPAYSYNNFISERYGWGFLFSYLGQMNGCDGDFFYGTVGYYDNTFGSKNYQGASCNLTGINEFSNHSLQIFPNPFSSELNIVLADGEIEVPVAIYDEWGELVYQKNIESQSKIDMSALRPGVYFLQYYSKGFLKSQKIFKYAD